MSWKWKQVQDPFYLCNPENLPDFFSATFGKMSTGLSILVYACFLLCSVLNAVTWSA